jgi:hypothetical protein
MGRKPLDLAGKTFGRLTIVRFHSIQNPKWKGSKVPSLSMWVVQCACGSPEKVIRGVALTSGNTKSCGCISGRGRGWPSGESDVLWKYRHQAKKRGLVWALSDLEFDRLVTDNCHYCGDPPSNVRHGLFTYNGIDRKDNMEGYVPGNAVSCCFPCNQAKREMSYEQFLAFIAKVSRHLNLIKG